MPVEVQAYIMEKNYIENYVKLKHVKTHLNFTIFLDIIMYAIIIWPMIARRHNKTRNTTKTQSTCNIVSNFDSAAVVKAEDSVSG